MAFGRYAGIVGGVQWCSNIWFKIWNLQPAQGRNTTRPTGLDRRASENTLPNHKNLLTGKGRVGNGPRNAGGHETQKSNVAEYLADTFNEPVYCQIDAEEYNKRKDGVLGNKDDFFTNPQEYKSNFFRFAKVTDFYIAGHFYGDGAPYLYTRDDAKQKDFKIKVVADVSCDIDGPVATTIKPSTIADPYMVTIPYQKPRLILKTLRQLPLWPWTICLPSCPAMQVMVLGVLTQNM